MNDKRGEGDWKGILNCLSLTGSLGFLMVGSIFGGFLIGWGIDWLLGTKAIFRIIFLVLGVAGGFANVYREISRKLG